MESQKSASKLLAYSLCLVCCVLCYKRFFPPDVKTFEASVMSLEHNDDLMIMHERKKFHLRKMLTKIRIISLNMSLRVSSASWVSLLGLFFLISYLLMENLRVSSLNMNEGRIRNKREIVKEIGLTFLGDKHRQ